MGLHGYVPRGAPITDEAIVVDLSLPVLCQSSKDPASRFVYLFDVSTSSEGLTGHQPMPASGQSRPKRATRILSGTPLATG